MILTFTRDFQVSEFNQTPFAANHRRFSDLIDFVSDGATYAVGDFVSRTNEAQARYLTCPSCPCASLVGVYVAPVEKLWYFLVNALFGAPVKQFFSCGCDRGLKYFLESF